MSVPFTYLEKKALCIFFNWTLGGSSPGKSIGLAIWNVKLKAYFIINYTVKPIDLVAKQLKVTDKVILLSNFK